MRETYPFNIDRGGIPLSTAQDGAVDATKRRIQLLADDLSRVLNGEKSKHRWQLVDSEGKPTDLSSAIAAMDQVSGKRASATFSQNKRKQRANHVPHTARQQQSHSDKAGLVERLYGGKGSLEKKFWPDA